MSKIEELIQHYCPDGVEWKTTFDVVKAKFWLMPSTPKFINEGVPYITSKNIKNGVISFDDVKYISKEDYLDISKNRNLQPGDLLISMIGTIGEKAFVQDYTTFYGQNLYVIRLNEEIINPRYYYYFFDTQKHIIIGSKNASSQGYIKAGNIDNIQLPVPPLPVQEEIVRILDTFTELQAELQAELQGREQQYKYFQDLLLNKSQFSTLVPIGELCEIKKGNTAIQKANGGIYPLVVTTMERKSCDTYQFNASAVCIPLVSSRGHGIASLNHVYYQEGKFALGNILCAVIPYDESVLKAKFLYYYLEYAKDFTLVPLMKGGANVSMHCSDVEKVKVPLPSIQEQEKIITILDKFDSITNILPSEIETRRQINDYYRDKLLTFKRKET